MKYALLIFPKPGSHEELSPEEYGPVNAQYLALREDPRCLGGAHLQLARIKGELFAAGRPVQRVQLQRADEHAGLASVLDQHDRHSEHVFAGGLPIARRRRRLWL